MTTASQHIIQLINDEKYEAAEIALAEARQNCSAAEQNGLLSIGAVLASARGQVDLAIDLQNQSLAAEPDNLQYKYRMACFLFDDERWEPAERCLKELTTSSVEKRDEYFLVDARFHRVVCLLRLNRQNDATIEFANIADGTSSFLFGKLIKKTDLLSI
jgi:tetratricopeptide (TPR) repeat protein